MTHGSLFSGIGGFDLAAEWMGWENIFHCEINPFCQKVLKYYWSNATSYTDITKTDFSIHRGEIDILTGGFPCQPFSLAGKRKGTEDNRYLWPEMLRAIREIQPSWVVGENVFGIVNWDGGMVFNQVQADLEAEGYEITPFLLPACAVNAPHRRDRIWFVAYRNKCSEESPRKSGSTESNWSRNNDEQEKWREQAEQHNGSHELLQSATYPNNAGNAALQSGINENREAKGSEWDQPQFEYCRLSDDRITPNASNQGLQRSKANRSLSGIGQNGNEQLTGLLPSNWQDFPTKPPICSRDDGLSNELDGITVSKHRKESIKAFGNAVVPQVVFQIFKAIELFETI